MVQLLLTTAATIWLELQHWMYALHDAYFKASVRQTLEQFKYQLRSWITSYGLDYIWVSEFQVFDVKMDVWWCLLLCYPAKHTPATCWHTHTAHRAATSPSSNTSLLCHFHPFSISCLLLTHFLLSLSQRKMTTAVSYLEKEILPSFLYFLLKTTSPSSLCSPLKVWRNFV